MSSLYQYRRLRANEIRLLSILKTAGSGIECGLRNVSLDDEPNFTALSYTWDNQSCDNDIDILDSGSRGKHQLKVSRNVLEALPYLAAHKPNQSWWIDAICINQADTAEKSSQIPLMGRVYTSAGGVTVWLGKPNSSLQGAIDAIPPLLRLETEEGDLTLGDNASHAQFGLPSMESDAWLGIRDLFGLPWFHRTWTLQEALLPTGSLRFLCGGNVIEWDALFDLLKIFARFKPVRMLTKMERKVQSDARGMFELMAWKRREAVPKLDALTMLSLSRNRSTAIPVDKVYGLLALIGDDIVDIDYEKPAETVFLHINRHLIANHPRGMSLIRRASNQPGHGSLPSWCPDWNSTMSLASMLDIYKTGKIEASSKERNLWPSPTIERQLHMRGYCVDEVTCAVGPIPPIGKRHFISEEEYDVRLMYDDADASAKEERAAQIFAWNMDCFNATKARYHLRAGETVDNVYHRTLIGDQLFGSCCMKMDASIGYSTFWTYMLSPWTEDYPKWNDIPDRLETPLCLEYFDAFATLCMGRSFFATKGGRIGVGPRGTRQGDSIVILPNGTVPFILRHMEENVKVHRLVGEAYVHGLMWGEMAEDLRDPGNLEELVLE